MKTHLRCLLILLSFLPTLTPAAPSVTPKALPAQGVNTGAISVSGVSSGAFFAVQMGVAFSSWITGVGSVAGGVYDCAKGDSERATSICMGDTSQIDLNEIVKTTQNFAAQNQIDPLSNLSRQKVYIFSGQNDTIVPPQSALILQNFYQNFQTPVVLKNDLPAGHGMPTLNFGGDCNLEGSPWLNKCNYDAAGAVLNTIYGSLNQPTTAVRENLRDFDQLEFGATAALMANVGQVYIPTACQAAGSHCRLHVAFHACLQSPDLVGDAYVRHAGYNEWAEANQIIVLYPAVVASEFNPETCWDWYGYTGDNYATSQGLQMQAIKAMVDRLSAQASHNL